MYPKTFWQTLLGSISGPNFYREILQKSWWFSFRFFLISTVLISWLLCLAIIKINLPLYRDNLQHTLQEFEANFPTKLEIDWNKTRLSINQTEPVVVPYPTRFSRPTDFPEQLAILVSTVDLDDDGRLPQHLPASSLAVVTSDKLFLTDFSGDWSEIPLTELPGFDQSFVLNQQSLPQLRETVNQMTDDLFRSTQRVLPLFLPVIMIITQLFDSLFYAVIGFFAIRMFVRNFSFIKVWQISLHLSVIALAVNQLAGYLYPQNLLPLYPMTFWILFLLIGWNLGKQRPLST